MNGGFGMAKRELCFDDGKSKKFWSISLSGNSHTVTYGRLGTKGQNRTKDFTTKTEAKKSYDRLIEQKLSKGYVDDTSRSVPGARKKSTPRKRIAKKTSGSGPPSGGTTLTVRDNWNRIKAWIQLNAPEMTVSFPDGVKISDIKRIEEMWGRTFPMGFRESLRIQCRASLIPSPKRNAASGFDCVYSLLDPMAGYNNWKMLTRLYDSGDRDDSHERVKPGRGVVKQWWSPGWFPFAENGAGDYYCLDLGPTFPGKRGQVIHFSHESENRPVISDSFHDFLAKLADGFHKNYYELGSLGLAKNRPAVFPDAKY